MPGKRRPRPSCEPLLVDIDNAGQMLGGVGRRSIEKLIADNLLEERRVGRLRLVLVASIRRYAEAVPVPAGE